MPKFPRSFVSFLATWALLSLALLGACRLVRPSTGAGPSPAGGSEAPSVEQLRQEVRRARLVATGAGLACLALPSPADREGCQGAVAGLRDVLALADGALAAAGACGEGDQRCLEAVAAQADALAPRLVDLAARLEQLTGEGAGGGP